MDRIPIAIVGCGGMGGRHLLGLKELYDTPLCNVELVAVCDLRRDNAEHLAGQAKELLGVRPEIYQSMEAMVAALPDLQGVDITTDSGSHHAVATAAFDLGLHVMCEKPMTIDAEKCQAILDAVERLATNRTVRLHVAGGGSGVEAPAAPRLLCRDLVDVRRPRSARHAQTGQPDDALGRNLP